MQQFLNTVAFHERNTYERRVSFPVRENLKESMLFLEFRGIIEKVGARSTGGTGERTREKGTALRRSNFRRHRRETSAASAPVDRWGLKATRLSILAIHYPWSRAYLGTMARDHEKRNLTKDGNGREGKRGRWREAWRERGGSTTTSLVPLLLSLSPSRTLSSFFSKFYSLLTGLNSFHEITCSRSKGCSSLSGR